MAPEAGLGGSFRGGRKPRQPRGGQRFRAPYRDDPESAHRGRIDHPDDRRSRLEIGLERRTAAALLGDEQIAEPELGQEQVLGRRTEGGQPGGRRGGVDGGEVDVRRQVLASDRGVWILTDACAR